MLGLTAVAEAQTVFTPTNTTSFAGNAVGVAAINSRIVASTSDVDFNFNLNLSAGSPASIVNSSNVADTGASANGLRNFQFRADGSFATFSNGSAVQIGGGNGGSVSSGWGISNSFLVGGNEYVWIGYTSLSANKSVGLFNLTAGTFGGASFTFTSSQTPTGLGNYSLVGGNTIADQRLLVSFNDNTFTQFTSGGIAEASYFWDTGATGVVQDITLLTNGTTTATLYGVTTNGGNSLVESAPFTIAAIPEPSTYAALAGLAALAIAAIRRRR